MRNFARFSTKKKPALLIIFLLIMQAVFGAGVFPEKSSLPLPGNCLIVLTTMNNDYRYITKDWQDSFQLVVENKGSTVETIGLKVRNNNVNCKNPDGSSNTGNVELDLRLEDAVTGQAMGSLTLQPGEKYSFNLRVKVPQQKALKVWSCAEVTATPVDCTASAVTIKLYSFVDSPDAE